MESVVEWYSGAIMELNLMEMATKVIAGGGGGLVPPWANSGGLRLKENLPANNTSIAIQVSCSLFIRCQKFRAKIGWG